MPRLHGERLPTMGPEPDEIPSHDPQQIGLENITPRRFRSAAEQHKKNKGGDEQHRKHEQGIVGG